MPFSTTFDRLVLKHGQTVIFDPGAGQAPVALIARANRKSFQDIETGELLTNTLLLVMRDDELDAAGHGKPYKGQHFTVDNVPRGVLGSFTVREGDADGGRMGYKVWVSG